MGNGLMMAGMIFQVVTLLLFGALSAEYAFIVWSRQNELSIEARALRRSLKFKCFSGTLVLAYLVILIRCVYQVAEMSGGWGNHIMREENLFTALDSLSVVTSWTLSFDYLANIV
jgi:hypothetical protein